MKAKATVCFRIPSVKYLETIFEALEPEANTPPTERSQTILRREKKSLILIFNASDTVALRATMNAYLRWIKSISGALKTLDNFS
ncbi:MAG: KEOPS complex subunit Pcc1 [Candidatus Bathyarchaeota archaeon]|jgi:tRNA threonylcarbamoyladenosine modification (KEOPS) complex  Pcc1 subunit